MVKNAMENYNVNRQILIPSFDQAIIETSDFSKFLVPNDIAKTLSLELRLCILFSNENDIFLITRTFLEESAASRIAMGKNRKFAEVGLVNLLASTVDARDERWKKQEKYANVRDIEKYRLAYYDVDRPKTEFSPYDLVRKDFDAGGLAHRLWAEHGFLDAQTFLLDAEFSEVLKRIEDADTGNSTWEAVDSQLRRSALPRAMRAELHAKSFTTYLDANRHNGINIVVGSRIANLLFTGPPIAGDFDLAPLRAFVSAFDIEPLISVASSSAILACRNELARQSQFTSLRTGNYDAQEELAGTISKILRDERGQRLPLEKTDMMPISKRHFRVALSFPGAYRNAVADIYAALLDHLEKHDVFYDYAFQSELSSPDLDLTLQSVYGRQSTLVVVFLSKEYADSEWCGLEWRSVRELIKKRERDKIMFVKFGDFEVDGVLSIDGYINSELFDSADISEMIIERLFILEDL